MRARPRHGRARDTLRILLENPAQPAAAGMPTGA